MPGESPADGRAQRAARNQRLFREVNERMRTLDDPLAEASEKVAIVCECSDLDCVEQLQLTAEAYHALRSRPNRFAVAPGHEHGELDRVVEERAGWLLVEQVDAGSPPPAGV